MNNSTDETNMNVTKVGRFDLDHGLIQFQKFKKCYRHNHSHEFGTQTEARGCKSFRSIGLT
jgi:hypothetical protein